MLWTQPFVLCKRLFCQSVLYQRFYCTSFTIFWTPSVCTDGFIPCTVPNLLIIITFSITSSSYWIVLITELAEMEGLFLKI